MFWEIAYTRHKMEVKDKMGEFWFFIQVCGKTECFAGSFTPVLNIHVPKESGMFSGSSVPSPLPIFLQTLLHRRKPTPDDPSPRDVQEHFHRVFKLPPKTTDAWFPVFLSYLLSGGGGLENHGEHFIHSTWASSNLV